MGDLSGIARIVLAENFAGLLGKAFLSGNRRFGAIFTGLSQFIRGFCFLAARIALGVTPAFTQVMISTGTPIARPRSRSARP